MKGKAPLVLVDYQVGLNQRQAEAYDDARYLYVSAPRSATP
jgi:hypothetical protein